MKRKLTLLLLTILCACTLAIGFAACNTTPNTPVPPPSGSEDEPKEDDTPPVPALTFDSFIKNYKTVAVKFFEDNVRPAVVENKDVKAENWHLNDKDGDNKVESASMSFVYSLNETERAVQVANVSFNPVDVQDIVDGKVNSINTTVSREDVFTFDAKENYQNQDLATALYNTAKVNADTKLFYEISAPENYRQFEIVDMKNNSVTISLVATEKGNGTNADFIYNLSNSSDVRYKTKSETKLDGVSLYSTAYTLEKFEETEKPGPEVPPETNITNAELISALEENCKIDLVKAVIPTSAANNFNEANLSNTTWYLTKDTDGNITKAELTFVYKTSDTAAIFVIGEMNFSTSISANDIIDGKQGNVTFNRTADRFSFNPSIQEERAELTNAICNKVFDENDNAVRFIYDHGNSAGSSIGDARHFTVMEVRDNSVHQIDVDILQSSNDSEYIAKLNNESNYTKYSEKTQSISGEKISVETNENTQEASARWAVDFGDDELYYL